MTKLSKAWAGSYEIVEVFDNLVYKLRNCRIGKLIKSRRYSNRLKPFTERRKLPPRQAESVRYSKENELLRPHSIRLEPNDNDSKDATQIHSLRQSNINLSTGRNSSKIKEHNFRNSTNAAEIDNGIAKRGSSIEWRHARS